MTNNNAFKIKKEQTTIDFDFGGEIMKFRTNDEHIMRITKDLSDYAEELKEFESKYKDSTEEDGDTLNADAFAELVEFKKESLKRIYDTCFEEGDFEKIYAFADESSTLVEEWLNLVIKNVKEQLDERRKRLGVNDAMERFANRKEKRARQKQKKK